LKKLFKMTVMKTSDATLPLNPHHFLTRILSLRLFSRTPLRLLTKLPRT
jgi:hypothetical protein